MIETLKTTLEVDYRFQDFTALNPNYDRLLDQFLHLLESIRHRIVDHKLLGQYRNYYGDAAFLRRVDEVMDLLEKLETMMERYPNTFVIRHDIVRLFDDLKAMKRR